MGISILVHSQIRPELALPLAKRLRFAALYPCNYNLLKTPVGLKIKIGHDPPIVASYPLSIRSPYSFPLATFAPLFCLLCEFGYAGVVSIRMDSCCYVICIHKVLFVRDGCSLRLTGYREHFVTATLYTFSTKIRL